jgi:hypothetical protein
VRLYDYQASPISTSGSPPSNMRGVATPQPENLRRWSMPLQKLHEVTVLGDHDCARCPGCSIDHSVFGVTQPEFPHRGRVQAEAHAQPHGERGGKLRIQPEDHATTTG